MEETIFATYKSTNPKYKNCVRSRVFNLKDKKNPSLRENVLCGVILPAKLAVMNSAEMASDEVNKQRQAFVKEGIDAAQLAVVQGTKTSGSRFWAESRLKFTFRALARPDFYSF